MIYKDDFMSKFDPKLPFYSWADKEEENNIVKQGLYMARLEKKSLKIVCCSLGLGRIKQQIYVLV